MHAHVYTEGAADPSFLADCLPEELSVTAALSRGTSGSSLGVKTD